MSDKNAFLGRYLQSSPSINSALDDGLYLNLRIHRGLHGVARMASQTLGQ